MFALKTLILIAILSFAQLSHAAPDCLRFLAPKSSVDSEKLIKAYDALVTSYVSQILDLKTLQKMSESAKTDPRAFFSVASENLKSEYEPLKQGLHKLEILFQEQITNDPTQTKILVLRFRKIIELAIESYSRESIAQSKIVSNRTRIKDPVQQIILPSQTGNYDLRFSPDSKNLAITGGNRVWIWNSETSALSKVVAELPALIKVIAFSSDGSRLFVAGNSGGSVWELNGTQPPLIFNHDGWLNSGRFIENDQKIITSSFDSQILIWDAVKGTEVESATYYSPILSMAVSADEKTVLIGTSSRGCALWDRETKKFEPIFEGYTHIKKVTMTRNAEKFFAIAAEHLAPPSVLIGSRGLAKSAVVELDGPKNNFNRKQEATSFALSSDEKYLAVGYSHGEVWIWDLNNLKSPVTKPPQASDQISSIAWSNDLTELAISENNGRIIKIWNLEYLFGVSSEDR